MAMSPTEHDAVREQAGLYVLDALSDSDREAFEAHLATCSDCRAGSDRWNFGCRMPRHVRPPASVRLRTSAVRPARRSRR